MIVNGFLSYCCETIALCVPTVMNHDLLFRTDFSRLDLSLSVFLLFPLCNLFTDNLHCTYDLHCTYNL
jgi:hypothetical protein